jgi:hypothetical protein
MNLAGDGRESSNHYLTASGIIDSARIFMRVDITPNIII